ncbi:hypothetical protein EON66_02095 [archaeon]|nr:MAG: hypothetical protein EON66_02095 [archaeon]
MHAHLFFNALKCTCPRAWLYRPYADAGSAGATGRAHAPTATATGSSHAPSTVWGENNWGHLLQSAYHAKSLLPLGGRSSTGEDVGTSAASRLSEGAGFDCFTHGSGLVNEVMLDAFRDMLEACDTCSGLQAIFDVQSGFGGVALAFLSAVRDECPRIPLLMFGTSPAATDAPAAGKTETIYAARDAMELHVSNLALGTALANNPAADLDATYIPLIPPHASVVGAYATAMLARAWDALLTPTHRVHSGSHAAGAGGVDEGDPSMAVPAGDWNMQALLAHLRDTPRHSLSSLFSVEPVHMVPAASSISSKRFGAWLSELAPLHTTDARVWASLSGVLPMRAATTFSHAVITRGIGSTSKEPRSEYDAAMLDLLRRTPCVQAVQYNAHTGIPTAYTTMDAEGVRLAKVAVDPQHMRLTPSMHYAATTSALAPMLADLAKRCSKHDHTLAHRFAAAGGEDPFADAAEILFQLHDEYDVTLDHVNA